MATKERRSRELVRLYFAVGLAVFILVIFRCYRLLSAQVELNIDAPSRWALLALGLTNTLAIGILLFIVARSLVKLYFERRSGILGSRIRTRLVVVIFLVSICPSLMLFLMGQTFIRKNVDRWFLPNTQKVIQDGQIVAGEFQKQIKLKLKNTINNAAATSMIDLDTYRKKLGLDMVARVASDNKYEVLLAPNIEKPTLAPLPIGETIQFSKKGAWYLEKGHNDIYKTYLIVGTFIPKDTLDAITHLERIHQESHQLYIGRETLETLPQSTFLFLTLLTVLASVWVGLTVAGTISEPVRNLAKAAKRVGRGDLEVLLSEQGEDELAMLSRSFNKMTKDLLHSRQAIETQSYSLENQKAYLNQLLEVLPVGVLSWQKDGVLHTFNSVARRWFCVDDRNILGTTWEEISQQSRSGQLPNLLSKVRKTRQPISEELRIGWEGEGRPIRAVVIPLSQGGELAVLEDLSLLAQAERRAAWQEVARRMAHEVRNPLTPIKLTTQRLLRRSQEGRLDPKSVAEGAETILAEVASIVRLVDSFSRFAKLPQPQPQKTDAVKLVQQAMTMFVPIHTRITWQLIYPNDPIEIFWDQDMVKRALINIVDNAISALESRTKDSSSTNFGRIRVYLYVDKQFVHIEVDDNGPGVAELDRLHLFNPYFSTKQKGTGLGLAIVHRIADDHGGEAYYQPLEPGSRFGIKLPMQADGV